MAQLKSTTTIGGVAVLGIQHRVGTILMYAGAAAPDGWQFCDGASCASSALSTFLGSSTVPNLQDTFIRGNHNDRGAALDPGRVLGTHQAEQLGAHTHTHYYNAGRTRWVGTWAYQAVGDDSSYAATSGAAGGTENRPKNTAVKFIIKY